MSDEPDFLDEIVAEGEAQKPGFALMVQAALDRRKLLRELAQDRAELGLSQTAVAAEMGTSQSAIARLESGTADIRMSTVERYAASLGRKVEWRIAQAGSHAATTQKSWSRAPSIQSGKAVSTLRSSAHFSEGHIPVAFVFSAPGEKERLAMKPVAGETGDNLESALGHLHEARPKLFPSVHRYDYRITNAWSEPIAVSRGHRSSEARDSEIRDPRNVQRVLRELEGCKLVVLSGDKARLVAQELRESGKSVVEVPHVGNKGLNVSFKLSQGPAAPPARRARRVQLWATKVLKAIPATAAST